MQRKIERETTEDLSAKILETMNLVDRHIKNAMIISSGLDIKTTSLMTEIIIEKDLPDDLMISSLNLMIENLDMRIKNLDLMIIDGSPDLKNRSLELRNRNPELMKL